MKIPEENHIARCQGFRILCRCERGLEPSDPQIQHIRTVLKVMEELILLYYAKIAP